MALNCELFQSEFSVLSGRLIKNMFPLHIFRPNDYTIQIIALLQIQLYNIFTNVLSNISKLFTNILKIYAKRVLLFCCIRCCPILYNKPCILKINIFGRGGTFQIWIIPSKNIDTQCLFKIHCRELGQYLMQFDALENKCNETTNYSI